MLYSPTGELYGCQDGHAVITGDDWIMSCPPTDEVASRSPIVYNELPNVTTYREIGKVFTCIIPSRVCSMMCGSVKC